MSGQTKYYCPPSLSLTHTHTHIHAHTHAHTHTQKNEQERLAGEVTALQQENERLQGQMLPSTTSNGATPVNDLLRNFIQVARAAC